MSHGAINFNDSDIDIEIRSPNEPPLTRLFRWPGSSFDEPEPKYRTTRFDPPEGSQQKFAMLYTADNIAAAAMECRVLTVDDKDQHWYTAATVPPYYVVRFQYTKPALFIRIEGDIEKKLGLGRFTNGYLAYQQASLALFERCGNTLHGLSWTSYHRGKPGGNYGFWHQQKALIRLHQLQIESACVPLLVDPEWTQLLIDFPGIRIAPCYCPTGGDTISPAQGSSLIIPP